MNMVCLEVNQQQLIHIAHKKHDTFWVKLSTGSFPSSVSLHAQAVDSWVWNLNLNQRMAPSVS